MGLRREESGGFTLLEVLLALTILALGSLAMTAGQISAIKTMRSSRGATEAIRLAQEQVETFRLMSGPDVRALIGNPNDPNNPFDPDPGDDNVVAYNRSWTIVDDTPGPDLISIQVHVQWVDGLGLSRTTTLETVKVDR